MKLVIVDDSESRISLIENAIESAGFLKYIQFVKCDSADAARRILISSCDLLILDILLPKKSNGIAQAINSVNLLAEICDPRTRYIRPGLIIGMTADVESIGSYQSQFAKAATVVIEGSMNDVSWLDDLLGHVESVLISRKKVLHSEKDRLLISIHGIRTYGQWQGELSAEIEQYSRSFEFVEIKYGYLDLIAFAVPYFRKKKVRRSAERVKLHLEGSAERDVYIVAHSFGTLIAAEALSNYSSSRKIKGIILCGSPMRSNQNIDNLVASSQVTINECGTRDLILVCARLLVLGLGDAGRIGFHRENSTNFSNRFFRGGHSTYFKKFDGSATFYDRFWLRFLTDDAKPEPYDARSNFYGEDFVDLAIKIFDLLKPVTYVVIGLLIFKSLIE